MKAPKASPEFTESVSLGRKANTTVGTASSAFGYRVEASGNYSHAEGQSSKASAPSSHAEGYTTKATGENSHAEGSETTASGSASHAEGANATASGSTSHAEGNYSTASGNGSHAEGSGTTASGISSHAEGYNTQAKENSAHAEGYGTIANASYSHVAGKHNIPDSYDNWPEWVENTHYYAGNKVKRTTGGSVIGYICKEENTDASFTSSKWETRYAQMNYVEIIGNGTGSTARSNARTLDWDGNERLHGDLYVNCDDDSSNGSKVATEAQVASGLQTKADLIEVSDSTLEAVKTFTDGADGVPMKITIGLEPVQDLHGYDNPWPGGTGKNLAKGKTITELKATYTTGTWSGNSYTENGVTFTCEFDNMGLCIKVSTSGTASKNTFFAPNTMSAKGGTTYRTVGCPAGGAANKYELGLASNNIKAHDYGSGANYTPSGDEDLFLQIAIRSGQNANGLVFAPMVCLATESDYTWMPYENSCPISGHEGANVTRTNGKESTDPDYIGETYYIIFPSEAGTVYGGMLNVNKDGTGSLYVPVVDIGLGSLTWTYNSDYNRMSAPLPSNVKYYQYARSQPFISDSYKVLTNREPISSVPNGSIYTSSNTQATNMILWVHDYRFTDASEFTTEVADKKIVIELAAPVTYTLTAEQVGQILSLYGTNNVWADTGDILSLDYHADTKLYVDRKLGTAQRLMELIITANREDSMKASKAYVSGDLIIVNGTLYKTSGSIANGATLTVGTNVTATTIAAEIAAIA